MSTPGDSGTPLAGAAGSARPSTSTVQFVEQWLWESNYRETAGMPWTGDYVRDAARMIEDALHVLRPNAQPLSHGDGSQGKETSR